MNVLCAYKWVLLILLTGLILELNAAPLRTDYISNDMSPSLDAASNHHISTNSVLPRLIGNEAHKDKTEDDDVFAGSFSLRRSAINGGGGRSSAGSFKITGTIGQHVATMTSSGGEFSVSGGFWGNNTIIDYLIFANGFES